MAWLDRLQSSVRDAGKRGGPRAFLDVRDRNEDESDVDSENKRTQLFDLGALKEEEEAAADPELEDPSQDAEKHQSSLPDSHVPLGLIADLSLSNSKANRKRDYAKDSALVQEDLNDDNVVCAISYLQSLPL